MATSPPRVVSLVPSVTEALLAWDVEPVACTRFCEQPSIRHVGGTKDPDLAAIEALAPDLVVVCDEENRVEDAEALAAAGLRVHTCSPRSAAEVASALAALAAELGVELPTRATGGPLPRLAPLGCRVFVPIWRRPWMSLADDTYGASLLAALGATNVAAELGPSAGRYPEVDLAAVAALVPDLVLAPSEPYAFRPQHLAELAEVAPVLEVDGQDLFWWGVRTPAAAHRLHRAVNAALT